MVGLGGGWKLAPQWRNQVYRHSGTCEPKLFVCGRTSDVKLSLRVLASACFFSAILLGLCALVRFFGIPIAEPRNIEHPEEIDQIAGTIDAVGVLIIAALGVWLLRLQNRSFLKATKELRE